MAISTLGSWSLDSLGHTVALRVAESDEAPVVRRLAALDDAPPLEGPVLLAVSDGEPVAAIALLDRRVVANPFVPTRDVVELLRVRAEHIHGPGPSSRRIRPALHRRAA